MKLSYQVEHDTRATQLNGRAEYVHVVEAFRGNGGRREKMPPGVAGVP